jgi:hypothetical protein
MFIPSTPGSSIDFRAHRQNCECLRETKQAEELFTQEKLHEEDRLKQDLQTNILFLSILNDENSSIYTTPKELIFYVLEVKSILDANEACNRAKNRNQNRDLVYARLQKTRQNCSCQLRSYLMRSRIIEKSHHQMADNFPNLSLKEIDILLVNELPSLL